MRKLTLLFFVILNTFAFSQTKIPDITNNRNQNPFNIAFVGKHFPIENFKNENGGNFTPDYFKGKITFINIWFTTCEPCIEEMPYLNQLKEKLGDKISFVGITFDNKEKVEKFLLKHQFNFNQLVGFDYKMLTQHDIKRFPTSFLLDSDGKIVYVLGNVTEDTVTDFVNAFSN